MKQQQWEIRKRTLITFFSALVRIGFVVVIIYMAVKYFAK